MSTELVIPSSHLIPCRPLLLLLPIPPSIRVFSKSQHEVAKVLEFQLQHQSFPWTPRTDLLQDGLVGSPCSPRDSQESSPTSQFKSMNSSALSFLHSPTLTSIHDHWENHSLDQTDLCWQHYTRLKVTSCLPKPSNAWNTIRRWLNVLLWIVFSVSLFSFFFLCFPSSLLPSLLPSCPSFFLFTKCSAL